MQVDFQRREGNNNLAYLFLQGLDLELLASQRLPQLESQKTKKL